MKRKEMGDGRWRSALYQKGAKILALRLNNPVLHQKQLNSSNTSLSDGVSEQSKQEGVTKAMSLSILPESPEAQSKAPQPTPHPILTQPDYVQKAINSLQQALRQKGAKPEEWDTPQKVRKLVGMQQSTTEFDPCQYFGGIQGQLDLCDIFQDPRLSDMFKPLAEARSLHRSCSPYASPRSYATAKSSPRGVGVGLATQKFLKASPRLAPKSKAGGGGMHKSVTIGQGFSKAKTQSMIKIGPKPHLAAAPLNLQKPRSSPRRPSVNTPTSDEKRDAALRFKEASFCLGQDLSDKRNKILSRPNSGSTMGTSDQHVTSMSQDPRSSNKRHISSLSHRSTTISRKEEPLPRYSRPSVADQLPAELQALFDKLSKESRQHLKKSRANKSGVPQPHQQKSYRMYLSKTGSGPGGGARISQPVKHQHSDLNLRSTGSHATVNRMGGRSPLHSAEWGGCARVMRPVTTKHSVKRGGPLLQTVELSLHEEGRRSER